MIHVPATLTADVLALTQVQIHLYSDPGRPTQAEIVQQIIGSFTEEITAVILSAQTLGPSVGAPATPTPIISDEFGLPAIHGLYRAVQFLERTGARREISLVIGGGLRTPAEFLKCLALDADAVYVGTAILMSGTHAQLSKSIPFEPITQIAWANGQKAETLDTEMGAETVANFLSACAGELAEGVRALGKRSVHEVNRGDLIAIERETVNLLGLPPSWLPPEQSGQDPPTGQGRIPPWCPPLRLRLKRKLR